MQERSVDDQQAGKVASILDATPGLAALESASRGSPEDQESAQFGPTQAGHSMQKPEAANISHKSARMKISCNLLLWHRSSSAAEPCSWQPSLLSPALAILDSLQSRSPPLRCGP